MAVELNRRQLLVLSAAAGAAALGAGLPASTLFAAEPTTRPTDPVKIHRVYVAGTFAAWPKPEFNAPAEVAKFEKRLSEFARDLPGIQLVGGETVQNPEQAAALASKLGEADAVLVVHLTIASFPAIEAIVNVGKPTAIFTQPFSGHDWINFRLWQKAGKRLMVVPSSDLADLKSTLRLLSVPGRLSRSRVLLGAVNRTTPLGQGNRNPWLWTTGGAYGEGVDEIKQRLGTEVRLVSVQQIVDAHKSIDPKRAEETAEALWIKPARKIIEPTREEIIKSAKMYLAMKKLLAEHEAQAITVHCLGGIPIDQIGYPCLGFSRLCDEGIPGACEADLDSTLTMLIFQYAFNVPGFITDPLFDYSKNAVIHAHCVAPTHMAGPGTARCPFLVRNHRDDNKGASLEVEMKIGQAITCAKLIKIDTMLISTGKITEIPDMDDRGCRTQITTQVADARKMMENWTGGLHRVVFYGDHLAAIKDLAYLMNLKVVQET